MAVDVKFCGLTRPQDAALGARLGARYLGAVFAPSPRRIDVARARDLFVAAGDGVRRVGVFAAMPADEIARHARETGLHVVQLHGDPTAADVRRVRAIFDGEIWAARRISEDVPDDVNELIGLADRILLDTRNGAALGGSGRTFGWAAAAPQVARLRQSTPVVVAGGLTPENVSQAIELLQPGVVDVSSGIESSPGVKDETLMQAFVRAVGASTT